MSTSVNPFVRSLIQDVHFSESAAALWNGKPISVEGIAGSSCALATAALFQHGDGSMIAITPDADSAEKIAEDITLFLLPSNNVLLFTPMEQRDYESESALAIADEAFGERVSVLKQLANQNESRYIGIVTTCSAASTAERTDTDISSEQPGGLGIAAPVFGRRRLSFDDGSRFTR